MAYIIKNYIIIIATVLSNVAITKAYIIMNYTIIKAIVVSNAAIIMV